MIDETKKRMLQNMWKQRSEQMWPAYNRAQTTEMRQFDILLKDILENVDEPVYMFGRPSLSIRDSLFCAVKKVYSHMSCRRSKGLYDNALEKGFISASPNFAISSRILNKKEITTILRRLVVLSSLPLVDIEEHFSVDSSGFRTTNFTEYFSVKHRVGKRHKWVKLHICIGTKTKIITDVVITEENAADTKQFKALVRNTAKNFNVVEVSADKAYSGRENLEIVKGVGAFPLIPFRSNTTGKSRGSPLWSKMFHYFKFHQAEFMARYHKRSNVEATFFMIKAKFGDSLRSRNKTAQVNELLCKILAHNLCVLLAESTTLGINPDFQNNYKEGTNDG